MSRYSWAETTMRSVALGQKDALHIEATVRKPACLEGSYLNGESGDGQQCIGLFSCY